MAIVVTVGAAKVLVVLILVILRLALSKGRAVFIQLIQRLDDLLLAGPLPDQRPNRVDDLPLVAPPRLPDLLSPPTTRG